VEALIREVLDLLFRWVHVIAGIMWIGNSMLFNWLDRNLEPVDPPREGVQGKIWLLHSGAFYEAEKKLLPAGTPYPDKVHWFMFQNLTTWVSGVCLLVLVYYMGGAAYMLDPSISTISANMAVLLGIGVLVVGWFVYDLLWRSPLVNNQIVAFVISFGLLVALTYALSRVLSGRAAYMHIGALMGTLMTGNVWFYIVPSQRELVAATKAGLAQDPALSLKAKQRSIHNNYMTFPVIFVMISGHFPSTYGGAWNWVILAVLMLGSATVRHFMNIRFTFNKWLRWAALAAITTIAITVCLMAQARGIGRASSYTQPVSFAEAQVVVQQRCASCHSAHPTDDIFVVAPGNVMFDTPEQIHAYAERIYQRAVLLKTMPLANKTNMSDEERELLGAWYEQGAPSE
jgi:uncharacterized membrane protein